MVTVHPQNLYSSLSAPNHRCGGGHVRAPFFSTGSGEAAIGTKATAPPEGRA